MKRISNQRCANTTTILGALELNSKVYTAAILELDNNLQGL